jgi:rfaE bifunctional protein kinase chain/domain
VIGDICADRWCQYDPAASDPSRETGIPRIGVVHVETTPGAGGTVANNLAALGAGKTALLGAIGQDGFGFELERALGARGIDYSNLVASPEIQTFTYSKIINQQTGIEDRSRIDFINNRELPEEVEDQLIANFHRVYGDYDAIIVSDQAETEHGGVITPAFREVIADVAERNPETVVIADSRVHLQHFRHVLAKPNVDEANAACLQLFGEVDHQRLRAAIGHPGLVVTLGAEGALLLTDDGELSIPAVPVGDPIDVCGAGDSLAAGMALALVGGADLETAVRLGVMVSSVTIMKAGTGVARPKEVLAVADTLTLS